MLSERQQRILELVVGAYLDSGRPVASRALAERPDVPWSPSTIRAELAALEKAGYLTHPHTSAGRVPTDSGYRVYADSLLHAPAAGRGASGLDLSRVKREVTEAMRETTAALARITDLMALVTAPPASSAYIHRIEVLRVQPRVVTVLVIGSNGTVTRRVLTFERPVDPGLVDWASSYLNERLRDLPLGARMIADRLRDRELGEAEAGLIAEFRDAFTEPGGEAEDLFVEGAARLLSPDHAPDVPNAEELLSALEHRASLLRALRSALDERSVFLWIGDENPEPELRSLSVVGANYGLGYRNLGTVGVVGPLRMDYARAIASVRDAASELSRFFATVYEG